MKFAAFTWKQWLGERDYDVYRLNEAGLCPPSTAKEWLRDQGYDPDSHPGLEDPGFQPTTSDADDMAMHGLPALVAGKPGSRSKKLADDKVHRSRAGMSMQTTNLPLPILGKQILRDGKTGAAI